MSKAVRKPTAEQLQRQQEDLHRQEIVTFIDRFECPAETGSPKALASLLYETLMPDLSKEKAVTGLTKIESQLFTKRKDMVIDRVLKEEQRTGFRDDEKRWKALYNAASALDLKADESLRSHPMVNRNRVHGGRH